MLQFEVNLKIQRLLRSGRLNLDIRNVPIPKIDRTSDRLEALIDLKMNSCASRRTGLAYTAITNAMAFIFVRVHTIYIIHFMIVLCLYVLVYRMDCPTGKIKLYAL